MASGGVVYEVVVECPVCGMHMGTGLWIDRERYERDGMGVFGTGGGPRFRPPCGHTFTPAECSGMLGASRAAGQGPRRGVKALAALTQASYRSLFVLAQFQGRDVAKATGFVAVHDHARYLITNWHVVSGRDTGTGKPLNEKTAATPDELVVTHHVAGSPGVWISRRERLYDGAGDPLWLEHPTHARRVDVVALPITNDEGIDFYPYSPGNPGTLIVHGPSDPVSIIGFPFGVTGGGFLGIWVQGSIATEPTLDFNELPCFLIDSRTRPGQSGSPAILYRSGGYLDEGGSMINNGIPSERFVGVYSGRINEQSDLGYVWKASALIEILDAQQRGPLPT